MTFLAQTASAGLLEQIVFPLFLLWFVGLTLVLIRNDIEVIWKVATFFVFVFYFFQFFPELKESYDRLTKSYPTEILSWLYGLPRAFYFFLLFFWPIAVFRMFYSASPFLANSTAKVLFGFTLVYWILFLGYHQFSGPIDDFLKSKFIDWITVSLPK
ncbi:hypothetical protein LEP1GSC058_4128 [Leptospira fainei serovar Hurstbridge str. BUT 6]|uniref:Uncharacterized protein n=1 Tax=Leptospira fainei serovar Hurstbridge str. BUT 6 TaxID=1193011 RepID=S3UT60_9LEPT|nr:hypothetical protein [Leptospira fainei]EPG73586.1 hypothetical protein LEP1GSC058_4128 [Leptospira fainei serovar Hurstbridge str. BUT 6]